MNKLTWFFALCCIGLIYFTFDAIRLHILGETIEAEILSRTISVEPRCGRGIRGLLCHLGFVGEEAHNEYYYRFQVKERTFWVDHPYRHDKGDKVDIIFVSGDPESSKILDGSFLQHPWVAPIVFLYMCLLTGIGMRRRSGEESVT